MGWALTAPKTMQEFICFHVHQHLMYKQETWARHFLRFFTKRGSSNACNYRREAPIYASDSVYARRWSIRRPYRCTATRKIVIIITKLWLTHKTGIYSFILIFFIEKKGHCLFFLRLEQFRRQPTAFLLLWRHQSTLHQFLHEECGI